jgi:hypothetical protein
MINSRLERKNLSVTTVLMMTAFVLTTTWGEISSLSISTAAATDADTNIISAANVPLNLGNPF